MKHSTGLRSEILLTLVLLLGTALLLGGFLMLQYSRNMLFQERIQQLEVFSRILAPPFLEQKFLDESSGRNFGNNSLSPLLLERLNCTGWRIYGPDLEVIESFATDSLSSFPPSSHQLALTTGQVQRSLTLPHFMFFISSDPAIVQFIVPVDGKRGGRGLLEVHYSLADISEKVLQSQKLIILYVCLFAAVLFLSGYYLLKKNVVNPAEKLLMATNDLSRGDFKASLPLEGPQEFVQIANSFNKMVYALQLSREETETHIRSLEKANGELSQTRDELIRSEKMATVGQLAAGMAHEIGNPLSAIIGYLELLKAGNRSEPMDDMITRSIEEAARIDFLVKELLNFSRPSSQESNESVHLVEELHSCVDLLTSQGLLAELDVVDKTDSAIPTIHFKKHKVQQVFINLLLNAVHACEKEGRICLSSGYDSKQVWVEIVDNGHGISPADMSRIFDPFYTTKDPGQGTGLGLAVSQVFVSEGNGRISVASEVGEGSSFRVCFPWLGTVL